MKILRNNFKLKRLPEYSKEALIAELQRVAGVAAGNKLTITEFSKYANVGITTLRRQFGSWEKALKAAGLSHLYNTAAPAVKSRTLARTMTNEQLVEEIRRVGRAVGQFA